MKQKQAHMWDRLPDETDKAFAVFQVYLKGGPNRQKIEVYRKVYGKPNAKCPAGYFSTWAKRFKWDERCKAWDDHLAQVEQSATEKAAANAADIREQRRQEIGEQGYEIGQKLIKRGAEMLASPAHRIIKEESREVSEDGHTTIIHQTVIEPVGFRAKDIPIILKTGVDLCRLATDMPTDRVNMEVTTADLEKVAAAEGVSVGELMAEIQEAKTGMGAG